jgi:hypothetical protein
MGFFSQTCPGCGHSIRADCAVKHESKWMNEAVVLFKGGGKAMGNYDGYGRLLNRYGERVCDDEEMFYGDNEVHHRTCWHLAGKPKFTKASERASDQGYFVGEYDPPEPNTVEDMKALKADGKRRDKEQQAAAKEGMRRYLGAKAAKDSLNGSSL